MNHKNNKKGAAPKIEGVLTILLRLWGMQIVTAVIIGAGRRGQAYASYATVVPKMFRIVGFAELFKVFREL